MVEDINMSVDLGGFSIKNPILTASGTYGYSLEYGRFFDVKKIGAIVTKAITLEPREGNSGRRLFETDSGMINSIGLENVGIEKFISEKLPILNKSLDFIVNIAGSSLDEYVKLGAVCQENNIRAIELNVSCPNVKEGGIAFGQNPDALYEITKAVKAKAKQPVIMKLSPNVTSIAEMARAAEAGGADAVSLINTLTGMKIDVERQAFVLANKTGGLSGPAIKPVAVRMVYETAHAVKIPIIGMGGICTAADALEFIMAGATAVSVGTANFHDPMTTMKVIAGMEDYMKRHNIEDINDLIGIVK